MNGPDLMFCRQTTDEWTRSNVLPADCPAHVATQLHESSGETNDRLPRFSPEKKHHDLARPNNATIARDAVPRPSRRAALTLVRPRVSKESRRAAIRCAVHVQAVLALVAAPSRRNLGALHAVLTLVAAPSRRNLGAL